MTEVRELKWMYAVGLYYDYGHVACRRLKSRKLQVKSSHEVVTYRKNSNIIRTIFTKNRGLVAGVRIIHVN